MQDAVQVAIADKLATITSLTSWLGDGANSILAEGDADPDNTPQPFLEIEFDGSRTTVHDGEEIEMWTIRMYDSNRGYSGIEQQLKAIRAALHNQILTADPSEDSYILTRGVRWMGDTPRGYNYAFNARTEGAKFEVRVFRKQDTI